jgi:uncharacterized protein YjeT (DUF2065 family)
MMAGLLMLSDEQMRLAGAAALAFGVLIVWIARNFLNV